MKNENRIGYGLETTELKFVYLRRPHPRDPVELCFGKGEHDCVIVKLSDEQLAGIARDAVALHFTRQVKA